MLSEDTKMLEYNQYQKSDKTTSIIYVDFELVHGWKGSWCKNNSENSSKTKVSGHIPSSFSMLPIWLIKSIENKHDVYRGKDYMKKFCEFLREHAMEIIIFYKKNEVISKRAAGIIRKYKNLLYLERKILK